MIGRAGSVPTLRQTDGQGKTLDIKSLFQQAVRRPGRVRGSSSVARPRMDLNDPSGGGTETGTSRTCY